MIHLWYTQHEFNHRVLSAVAAGLARAGAPVQAMQCAGASTLPQGEHICYGVLRGADAVLKASERLGLPWYHIDNGYFRPGHFHGYYRISKGNTQAHFSPMQAMTGERWRSLDLAIAPWQRNPFGHVLICPPTPAMGEFFGIDVDVWLRHVQETLSAHSVRPVLVRHKHASSPLEDDLRGAYAVVTFNSSVAWQALQQGIPAIADRQCVVHSWNHFNFADIEQDLTQCDRLALFQFLANNQFTLNEFAEQPELWVTALRTQVSWSSVLQDAPPKVAVPNLASP